MRADLDLVGQLLRLAADPNVCLHEFRDRVASSPWLCERVVRAANSPLYGMGGKITGLERAVLILGARAVAAIACGVLLKRELCETRGDAALWARSLRTGLASRLIARQLELSLEWEAYLAGLLHAPGAPRLDVPAASRCVSTLVRAAHLIGAPGGAAPGDASPDSEAARCLADLGLASDDVARIRGELDERVKELATALSVAG